MEEFVIPLNPEDLINLTNNPYTLQEEIEVKSDGSNREMIEARLSEQRVVRIGKAKNFDSFFCLSWKVDKLDENSKPHFLILLADCMTAVSRLISSYLKESNDDQDTRRQTLKEYRSALKIVLYGTSLVIQAEEVASMKRQSNNSSVSVERKKKSSKNAEQFAWDVSSLREGLLSAMVTVLGIDLKNLWGLAQPEEEFLQLFSKSAFQLMENPANARDSIVWRCISGILASLTKKYGFGFQITINLVNNVLCKHEHAVQPIVELMTFCAKEDDNASLVSDILREIAKLSPRVFAKDSVPAKTIGTFIGDLAARLPQIVLPVSTALLQLLETEAYMLRNGVIQVIGHLIDKAFDDADVDTSTRDNLIEVLLARFADVNSYTRGKAVQVWSLLAQNRKIPLKSYSRVAAGAVKRLHDKSSVVRKAALVLLAQLIEFNPYSPQLNYELLIRNAEKTKILLEESTGKPLSEILDDKQDDDERSKEELNLLKMLRYYRDTIAFLDIIHSGIPFICELLVSRTQSDVLESATTLQIAYLAEIKMARLGIRKMLALVWSKEEAIRKALINTYVALFLTPKVEFASKAVESLFIAKNIIKLTTDATVGEMTCLEELISILFREKLVPVAVVDTLWDIFGQTEDVASSRGALMIICMMANSDPRIVKNHLSRLVSTTFGDKNHQDPEIVRWACITLQKLSLTPKLTAELAAPGEIKPAHERFNSDHIVFQKLAEFLKVSNIAAERWFPAAEQAISAIYAISENPDVLMGTVIRGISQGLFPQSFTNIAIHEAEGNIQPDSELGEEKEDGEESLINESTVSQQESSSSALARLLFIVGHTSLKQLVYIEDIHKELRRRRLAETRTASSGKGEDKLEAIEKELGTQAMTAEQQEEKAQARAEQDIVLRNLLGSFGSILVAIASNVGNLYNDPLLRSSAVLALSKFMVVSSEFCEKHLRLLFSILEGPDSPSLRANIVIVLGDLAFRYPNLLQPYSYLVYRRLRDKDTRVRKNTLMVLTHLLLNDMIKATGQMSEMALSLVDEETRVRDLARLFFQELSTKANTIYNILPDVISTLSSFSVAEKGDKKDEGESTSKIRVTNEHFTEIMQFLLAFIDKETQVESLIAKLCHRFKTEKPEPIMWRNISYCLGQLNIADKHVRKLSEQFRLYKEALADKEVYSQFEQLIVRLKKNCKSNEVKTLLEELESKIQNHHDVADDTGLDGNAGVMRRKVGEKAIQAAAAAAKSTRDQERAAQGANEAPKRGRRAAVAPTPAKRRAAPKRIAKVESDDEGEEEKKPKKPPARAVRGRKPVLEESSDELDSDSEESSLNDSPKKPSNTRARKRPLESEEVPEKENQRGRGKTTVSKPPASSRPKRSRV